MLSDLLIDALHCSASVTSTTHTVREASPKMLKLFKLVCGQVPLLFHMLFSLMEQEANTQTSNVSNVQCYKPQMPPYSVMVQVQCFPVQCFNLRCLLTLSLFKLFGIIVNSSALSEIAILRSLLKARCTKHF